MPNDLDDDLRVLRTAAWLWAGYLLALACIDALIYAGRPLLPVMGYHLINQLPALLFLGLTYSPWAKVRPSAIIPGMLLLISIVPIILTHGLSPRLPPAPLSNIEGMALRQLPVLFIGMLLVAWHYRPPVMFGYSLVVNLVDLLAIQMWAPYDWQHLSAFYFVVIVRTVSMVVVGVFISQLLARLRAQHAALQAVNTQLAQYAGTLETLAVSRERNRLARELHDTLAHTLSGLSVQLETVKAYWDVDAETARRLLGQSLDTTRFGLDETRRALKALRTSPLDDLGLRLALQDLAHSAAQRGQLRLDLSLPDYIPTLAPDIEQCLYRVAQEALENVVNHANAASLQVHLALLDTAITLEVQDDGLGADLTQPQPDGHYGMAGMRERAQLAGGRLQISSQPGQGTCIQLEIKRTGL